MLKEDLNKIGTLPKIVLHVESISKKYGKHVVLNNVSFDLFQGEIIGIIGPSGCGKTTLLRCLDFLTFLDKGTITYPGIINVHVNLDNQIEIKQYGSDNLLSENGLIDIRKKIGFVFQSFNLWEEKTVLQNLVLAPKVVHRTSNEILLPRVQELCNQFGLKEKINSKVFELSGGQKQRVAIIRALMLEPLFMYLDEITSALDPMLTFEVLNSIKQLKGKGMSMLIVTHHIHFAESLCDRIMYIQDGEIIQLDKPHILRNSPATHSIRMFLETLDSVR